MRSLGTAVLGAIFSNRLSSELRSVLPAGAAHANTGSTVNPKEIAGLPPLLRDGYLHAFTNALSTVFLVASAFAIVAFALSWFIRQLPLRETVASPDMADTFASPRGADSLDVVIDQIGRLDRRDGAREIRVLVGLPALEQVGQALLAGRSQAILGGAAGGGQLAGGASI